MITRSIIEFFIGILPSFTFPLELIGAFTEAGTMLLNINHYIPINTFLGCVTIYFFSWITCAVISAILQLL